MAALYCPRKLSKFIPVGIDDVDIIFVRFYGYEEGNGDGREFNETALAEEEYSGFLSVVKNLKIYPKYCVKGADSSFSYFIVCGADIYEINGGYVNCGNRNTKGIIDAYALNELLNFFTIN